MPNLSPDQEITLWIGALDYYLGRMTYAVHTYIDLLKTEYPNLQPATQNLVKSRLKEAFAREQIRRTEPFAATTIFGHEVDRQAWLALYQSLEPDNDL